jgi:hypothetical protein
MTTAQSVRSPPATGALEGAALQPEQPLFEGGVGGGAGPASVAGAADVDGAADPVELPAVSVADELPAAAISGGTAPPLERNVSGGTAPRTKVASVTAPARGVKPIFVAGWTGALPMPCPGLPPHTPRRGWLQAMGPVHG